MFRVVLAAAMIAMLGCTEPRQPAPFEQPSFDSIFPALTGDLMSVSSPRVVDLDGDGDSEIVFGIGVPRVQPRNGVFVFTHQPDPPAFVLAVEGETNRVLWRAAHTGDAFTTPQFAKLNGDDVLDVIMGGREAAFAAFSGTDGALLWRTDPAKAARTPVPYNFFTPAVVRDLNGDGIQDLVVAYGGDDTRLPSAPRDAGYLVVVSGIDGKILASHRTPDGSETYSAVVVYERPDGRQWVIFGTGGETYGGAAYRVPVTALLDGTFDAKCERLIAPGVKGVLAPATLIDIDHDGELDIVISTFDGRLAAVNGATGKLLWLHQKADEEAYHSAAVARVAPDSRPGLLVSRGLGSFPRYRGSAHRLHDAADGRVLFEHTNGSFPGGAPLAVDLNGDDIDEPFFFSVKYPNGVGARIHVLQAATRMLITYDVPTNYWTTPVIADAARRGRLELIGLSWLQDTDTVPEWTGVQWQLSRLDLNAKTPEFMSWSAYMGTHSDGRSQTRAGPPSGRRVP
jgi:outer membrane protein assembly factor BamB